MSTLKRIKPPAIELYALPGIHRRVLVVTVTTDRSLEPSTPAPLDLAPHADASSIIDLYAFAVAVGCFGDAPLVSVDELSRITKGEMEILTFTLELLPLPLEALKPLLTKARNANAFGGSLARFVVEERGSARPPVIDVEALRSLPPPNLHFSVDLPGALEEELKENRVTVTFQNAVEVGALSRTQGAFEGWSGVLMAGFEGRQGRYSRGTVTAISRHLVTDVVASIESVTASEHAWDALLRALDVVHREVQAIERVRIS
jgi:hypothetical protein